MPMASDDKEAQRPLLPTSTLKRRKSRVIRRSLDAFMLIFFVTLCVLGMILIAPEHFTSSIVSVQVLESCAWKTLHEYVSLLDVPPITRTEFLKRQSFLAAALDDAGVDAFIAEPSASTSYYANISTSYSLSERPFLMILDKNGQFSYLAPKFELTRIASLEMVFNDKKVIEWGEEESPYEALKKATGYSKIMLDEHARFMIATGLQAAGVKVIPTTQSIQALRAVKSEAELAILRGVNEFTLQLVRSMQKCINIGMTQDIISTASSSLFTKAGISGEGALVLFGDRAANPHGGSTGKTLSNGEFVLIDIGASLHGYRSDVTRTFLPLGSKISDELRDLWYLVYGAQSAAIRLMNVNETCSVVDAAARQVTRNAGYAQFFTHRLGHGLGLETHEHPYLNGANDEKLKAGEVVTNEPGIYVTTEQAQNILDKDVGFGIRIEDPILVTADGGYVMTGSRAISPYEP